MSHSTLNSLTEAGSILTVPVSELWTQAQRKPSNPPTVTQLVGARAGFTPVSTGHLSHAPNSESPGQSSLFNGAQILDYYVLKTLGEKGF